MGLLQGQLVHNHTTGSTCETVVVLADNSANYNTVITGNRLQQGLLGVLDSAARNNLARWVSDPAENNTWHFVSECPFG